MSAKDAVWARDQSKRRPVRMPIEQSVHKRKPQPVKAVEPVVIEVPDGTEEIDEATFDETVLEDTEV